MKWDYLIVGAGLFGATFARIATDRGKKCLVIDKRDHTGGNIYCQEISGINVHKYGPHIFHTSDKHVWDFVNKFTPFNRFTNCPLVQSPDGNIYNLPFNMNTFHQLWGVKTPKEALKILEEQRSEVREKMKREDVEKPRNLEEQALSLVGKDIYECFIKGYTEKQWGRPCEKLPSFIIRRLPIRLTYDNNYFNDTYQGIPIGGYNKLTDGLLKHIEIHTSTNFFENRSIFSSLANKIIFTGRIDEFYDYRFGELEYRNVRFETEILNIPNFQGNAVVNYTSKKIPFTRIIEHKHFECFGDDVYKNPKTVISREYPSECNPGKEPFYPINNEINQEIYNKYLSLAKKEENVIFGGRLAEYKYYDMAPIIQKVLDLFENNEL